MCPPMPAIPQKQSWCALALRRAVKPHWPQQPISMKKKRGKSKLEMEKIIMFPTFWNCVCFLECLEENHLNEQEQGVSHSVRRNPSLDMVHVQGFMPYSPLRVDKKVYSTRYSQVVIHPSTNQARHCLSSMIGQESVFRCSIALDGMLVYKGCISRWRKKTLNPVLASQCFQVSCKLKEFFSRFNFSLGEGPRVTLIGAPTSCLCAW